MGRVRSPVFPWFPVLIATIVGGGVTGLLFHYQLFILQLFGAFVGRPSVLGGAAVHAGGSLVIVSLFGVLVNLPGARVVVASAWRVLVAGFLYGLVVFAVGFGVLLPGLTDVFGIGHVSIPYLPFDALVIHLIFGGVVGLTFAVLWSPPERVTA